MWNRYEEPLSLTDLADTAMMSKFRFSRVFRNLTGTSPRRFLTAIRLSISKHLLLETSLSISEISFLVGYNSLRTFTNHFTRTVGMCPVRYRSLSNSRTRTTRMASSPILDCRESSGRAKL